MLAAIRAIGGDVKLAGSGRLKVVAPAPLPNELIEQLRAVKPDLMPLLTQPTPTVQPVETWTESEEERAAIVEYDGGAPRAWAEALARLDPTNPPGDVPSQRWVRFIDDCGRFLDGGWASRAAELGWRPLDLFGCDRERPFAHVDYLGLPWLLNGRKLIALTAETAVVDTRTGGRQPYQRLPVEVGRVVPAWELATENLSASCV
jgi:hypothetical protein